MSAALEALMARAANTEVDSAPGVPCDTCDGHGFFMVNAHGPQEVKCDTCSGTGNKSGTQAPVLRRTRPG